MSQEYVQRASVKYKDLCDQFRVKDKSFALQYYSYYMARLSSMTTFVKESVSQNWGTDARIVSLSDLSGIENGERVVIIGIIFKHMQLQPTILKEISEDNQLIPQPTRDRYIEDSDYLILQAERESVKLTGNLSVHSHTTGIVIGLLGYVSGEAKEFVVEDYCYPITPIRTSTLSCNQDKYVLLISGLGFSPNSPYDIVCARNMLFEFLSGLINEEMDKAAKIVRMIIAGNMLSKDLRVKEEEADKRSNRKPWEKKTKSFTIDSLKIVDDFIVELSKSIHIDIMPGETDPTGLLLPQEAIHPCILPKSSISTAVRCVTNPYQASFDGAVFLGSSGQNIDNIRQYTELDDPITILEKTLVWRHMAPSSPDTLQSYPSPEKDPFIIQQLPHVYFVGNQKKFAMKTRKIGPDTSVKFISVPDFESTLQAVLVNLKDLTCELMGFSV